MNIEDWLDNANLRLENRSVSYAALATEDLPLALIMVRAALDRHPKGKATVMEYTAAGEVEHCLGCRGAHSVAHDEYGLVPWPYPTVRAIENTLKEYT